MNERTKGQVLAEAFEAVKRGSLDEAAILVKLAAQMHGDPAVIRTRT